MPPLPEKSMQPLPEKSTPQLASETMLPPYSHSSPQRLGRTMRLAKA
jgi:hypothetical protein